MVKNTKIEWATHTFNPWVGCTKVSPACDHCYAESWAKRSGLVQWGPSAVRRRTTPTNWRQPVRWNRRAQIQHDAWERFKETNPGTTDDQLIAQGFIKPQRPRVFCASLADVFDTGVPVRWRMDLFSLIANTPYLDWLLLTKRIGNVMKMCSGDGLMFDMIASRVWLGITVCNQDEADRDIPKLLSIPAAKRFLSMEPLLGLVDLTQVQWPEKHKVDVLRGGAWDMPGWLHKGFVNHSDMSTIDWVIVGGESGPKARPMRRQWVHYLRNQCNAASVPFFFKQWGEWAPANLLGDDDISRAGKRRSGRMLDGRTWDEVPASY